MRFAAAPTQVSAGPGTCPDCGYEGRLVGIMYGDRVLRCGACHDDYFYDVYAEGTPEELAEARVAAERRRDEILRMIFS